MVIRIALDALFGFLIAAMVLAPLAAADMEREQREQWKQRQVAAKRPVPVSLVERRALVVAPHGTNNPQVA